MATLKQRLGEAGAGLDQSMGDDRLYDVMHSVVTLLLDLVTQFNQFRTDYNATTVPTTATALSTDLEIE